MKTFAFLEMLFASVAVFATPVATVSSFASDASNPQRMKVVYTLSESAVVTASVLTGTQKVPGWFSGDVNILLDAGEHTLYWRPEEAFAGGYAAGKLTVDLAAYATDDPPLYMAVYLRDASQRVRYYATADEVPGTPTSGLYKSDYMLFRRIPAKGETCLGKTFTADYYMAIYETTLSQLQLLKNAPNQLSLGANGSSQMPCYYQDAFPASTSFSGLRKAGGATADPHSETPDSGSVVSNIWARYTVKMDLPLQAEWEFAARAGETGDIWAGMAIDDVAWTTNNSSCAKFQYGTGIYYAYAPHPVGLKKPNPWGLYDTLGNMSEWCLEASSSGNRYLRGGGHASNPLALTLSTVAECGRTYWDINMGAIDKGTVGMGTQNRTIYGGGYRFWAPAVAVR